MTLRFPFLLALGGVFLLAGCRSTVPVEIERIVPPPMRQSPPAPPVPSSPDSTAANGLRGF